MDTSQRSTDGYLDLRDGFALLWRGRWVIVVAVLVFGAAAFLRARIVSPTYEAEVLLRQAPLGADRADPLQGGAAASRITDDLIAMLASRAVAARVIGELKLTIPVDEFMKSSVAVRSTLKSATLISVRAYWTDPGTAAALANRFAEEGVLFNRSVNQEEARRSSEFLGAELDQSRASLEAARSRLLEFRRQAQIELLRKDVDALLEQRGRLPQVAVALGAELGRLQQAEKERSQRQPSIALKRAVAEDPITSQAIRDRADVGALLGVQVETEVLNPVYVDMDGRVADARTRIEALTRERREISERLGLGGTTDGRLAALYERELDLARHTLDVTIAERAYADLADKHLQARVQVARRTADLQIVDRAVEPTTPVAPRPLRDTVLAALLGGVLAIIGWFGYWIAGDKPRPTDLAA